mmetsp:Transcript_38/g.79  ORF Transcript_38/g.79 Transcript_38/m.79 type:complete len:201 (-) Transcript_38:7-609(-)
MMRCNFHVWCCIHLSISAVVISSFGTEYFANCLITPSSCKLRAMMSAVSPYSLVIETSAPARNRALVILALPESAANINGVKPSLRAMFGLAPCSRRYAAICGFAASAAWSSSVQPSGSRHNTTSGLASTASCTWSIQSIRTATLRSLPKSSTTMLPSGTAISLLVSVPCTGKARRVTPSMYSSIMVLVGARGLVIEANL